MKCAKARTPLHLSIVWLPVRTGDPLTTGSLGAGLILEPPVEVKVCEEHGGVAGPLPPPARRCLEALGWRGERVEVHTPYPLGYGLGASGSVALAACLAYAALRRLPSLRAADEAHIAEVVEATGLGDVTAVYTAWGLEVRVRPGAPGAGGVAEAYTMPRLMLYAVPVAAGETLLEIRAAETLSPAARRYYEAVRRNPGVETLAEAAKNFTMRVTPPPERLAGLVREAERCSELLVYKKGTLAVIPRDGCEEKLEKLLEGVGRVYKLTVTNMRPTAELV